MTSCNPVKTSQPPKNTPKAHNVSLGQANTKPPVARAARPPKSEEVRLVLPFLKRETSEVAPESSRSMATDKASIGSVAPRQTKVAMPVPASRTPLMPVTHWRPYSSSRSGLNASMIRTTPTVTSPRPVKATNTWIEAEEFSARTTPRTTRPRPRKGRTHSGIFFMASNIRTPSLGRRFAYTSKHSAAFSVPCGDVPLESVFDHG